MTTDPRCLGIPFRKSSKLMPLPSTKNSSDIDVQNLVSVCGWENAENHVRHGAPTERPLEIRWRSAGL